VTSERVDPVPVVTERLLALVDRLCAAAPDEGEPAGALVRWTPSWP
jgi:hypothetical protein